MAAADDIASLDRDDPLAAMRGRFDLPEDVIYLDGNSLGPLPRGVRERLAAVIDDEWRQSLVGAWNRHGWIDLPERVGDRLAPLLGAPPGSVTLTDTLSLNVVKALSAALELNPGRRVILSDDGNFPSDLYMAEGLIRATRADLELRLVAPGDVAAALDDTVAVLLLTEVDYRSGRRHDLRALTAAAHAAGALTVWDLAHSAGAIDVDLAGADADFAVGCTYKYLNAGPGAPAFVYVRPDLQDRAWPLLCGWLGHEEPFAFDRDYRPAPGIRRMRVGTPPVLALAALDAALDLWDDVDMALLRQKSVALGERFIAEVERRCADFDLRLASPRDPARRGSQVSFRHADGYAVMQALIARGVIGDFRAPDILRFGFAPLYLRHRDVVDAAAALEAVLRGGGWRRAAFRPRDTVT